VNVKIDVLILIFDFYVPALTPRLNNTENSLLLSENIKHSAVTDWLVYRFCI
jgi:hypothetical protein